MRLGACRQKTQSDQPVTFVCNSVCLSSVCLWRPTRQTHIGLAMDFYFLVLHDKSYYKNIDKEVESLPRWRRNRRNILSHRSRVVCQDISAASVATSQSAVRSRWTRSVRRLAMPNRRRHLLPPPPHTPASVPRWGGRLTAAASWRSEPNRSPTHEQTATTTQRKPCRSKREQRLAVLLRWT